MRIHRTEDQIRRQWMRQRIERHIARAERQHQDLVDNQTSRTKQRLELLELAKQAAAPWGELAKQLKQNSS
jgi:hypothetical protein